MHKTSAWPLSLIYMVLVVYASLYPFTDWRLQGVAPWAFLLAPLPRYWTMFDLLTNLVGYVPLGFLLAIASQRSTGAGHAVGAVIKATAWTGGLSLLMESLQNYLPVRVPSNVDLLLNVLGGALGASTAAALERLGAIDRWSQFRDRWFVPYARGALVLLALWPFGLLFPAAVPFGLGHVLERLEAGLAMVLANTPFLAWLPVRDVELQPLVPGVEMLCVLLGALLPALLGYSIIPQWWRRSIFLAVILALGCGASAMSAALSYGPEHAWAWLTLPVQVGLVSALVFAVMMLAVPIPGCAGLLLLVLVVHASLLNGAPTSSYFAQTLQTWEQGRFIRFNGLAQWIGWLWPYVTLLYVLARMSDRETKMPRSSTRAAKSKITHRRWGDRLLKSDHDVNPFPKIEHPSHVSKQ